MPRRLLVVATHADDETIASGGLIARAVESGAEVRVLVGRLESAARRDELLGACRLLGAASTGVLSKSDRWLDGVPLSGLVGVLEAELASFRPDWFVLPDYTGFHQEHAAVGRACVAACRPAGATGRFRPPVVLMAEQVAEVWPPHRAGSSPTFYVGLSERHVGLKVEAMTVAHASQARPVPSERSGVALAAAARVRGAEAGEAFAEAYTVLRWLV